ncbi:class III extradiol ring-cleavage dioxygenase [Dechloromonas sp. ZY10]|uniref:DODA-type extradiol aromatic ring-opening family dioxygenase n=1 Tax=Dechloromonas aquae TaxID=2664436 RepID=UPI0035273F46
MPLSPASDTTTPALLPTLFVPHGAPTFALKPGAAGAAIARLADKLPRPRAVIVVSAHWQTPLPTVGSATRLETIHDFWGFPDELYALRYPASGCPEAAREIAATLSAAGVPVALDNERGLDHGAWVPLRLLYPEADVPVIPLSLPLSGGPQAAWELGRALAPLSKRGFLIVGSGSVTHNLRDYQMAWRNGGQTPAYVRQFADWVDSQLQAGDTAALLAYRQQAPGGAQAHPSDEHLLPLFVAWGAAQAATATPAATRLHAGIDDFVIAMDLWAFGTSPEQQSPDAAFLPN